MRARWMAVAIMLMMTLFSPGTAWGDAFDDAVNAANRGDYASALPVFHVYAEAGFSNAQLNLGRMYTLGHGVLQDYREAAKWFRLAAEQGVAEAQSYLGNMYSSGTGVLQDYREALRWRRKAAAQGYATAMANLGAMYSDGRGVPRDYVRAHMWANLAAAAGDAQYAGYNRDVMVGKMTPAQIAEAQRLARECLASNYQRCGEPEERPATPARSSRPPKPAR
jgi:TPR repeat protein